MPDHQTDKPIVHVVDDDASMRFALEELFGSVGLRTRSYAAAQDFISTPPEDGLGCVVIDIRLPDMNGLEFQSRLSRLGVRLPVIMITGHGDVRMSVRAMKLGAVDFLPKPFRDQDILDAVMTAIERDRDRRAAHANLSRVQDRFETLSTREKQVMLLVTAGKMNKQVGGDLGISEITVKIHRGAAMRKMGAQSLADLVRMAELLNPKES